MMILTFSCGNELFFQMLGAEKGAWKFYIYYSRFLRILIDHRTFFRTFPYLSFVIHRKHKYTQYNVSSYLAVLVFRVGPKNSN